MALSREILKTEIKTLLDELKDDLNQVDAIDKYAEQLSSAIDTYIKSATVTVTGTSVSGGPVTGTGIIS